MKRFLVIALGLYLFWYLAYDLCLKPDGRLDNWLTSNAAQVGAWTLNSIGFETEVVNRSRLLVEHRPAVWIDHPCNGLEMYVLFAGFILAFPGPWKNKILFIPFGILTIYLLNIIRIALLAINHHVSRNTFDFNHKYLFTYIVYILIFGLWVLWVNKFAQPTFIAKR